MPTNDFLPFCLTDTGSNLLSQSEYAADGQRTIGAQPGVARSKLNNKVERQANFVVSQIAQFISDQLQEDVLDDGDTAALLDQISRVFTPPSGVISAYGGATAPDGFLLCDGTSYLRATYANLFSIIGTTFGSADGTHFNVPDMRNVFPRGANASTRTISGNLYPAVALGATVVDSLKAHNHIQGLGTINSTAADTRYGMATGIASATNSDSEGSAAANQPTQGVITSTTGGTETAPVNLGLNYIIKI